MSSKLGIPPSVFTNNYVVSGVKGRYTPTISGHSLRMKQVVWKSDGTMRGSGSATIAVLDPFGGTFTVTGGKGELKDDGYDFTDDGVFHAKQLGTSRATLWYLSDYTRFSRAGRVQIRDSVSGSAQADSADSIGLGVNRDSFGRIRTGMTRSQVEELIGFPGEFSLRLDDGRSVYVWRNADSSNISVGFDASDRVVTKASAGL